MSKLTNTKGLKLADLSRFKEVAEKLEQDQQIVKKRLDERRKALVDALQKKQQQRYKV